MLGFCSKGAACTERHVHECPDYANKGLCRNSKCRLPHVDRAGQLRKAAAVKCHDQSEGAEGDVSDLESDEEVMDSDDVDSDDMEEHILPEENKHELSQQQDFVQF